MIPEYHGTARVYVEEINDPIERIQKSLEVSYFDLHNIWNISNGYFSPCDGFHGYEEIRSILEDNSLPDGTRWSVPLILSAPFEICDSLRNGENVKITFENRVVAILEVYDKFAIDMEWYMKKMFGLKAERHPFAKHMNRKSNMCISGKIISVRRDNFPFMFKSMDTENVRKIIQEKGFHSVCGFQTRNAPHRGHEFIHKLALLNFDSIALTPSIGPKKEGDLPDNLIMLSYETYRRNYVPSERTLLIPVNYAMIYAGPREAFLHMIMRKNMGCSHFIVGRDHAGTDNIYGQDQCREYLTAMGNVGITPVFVDEIFYCKRCDELCTERTCPHSEETRIRFSGTLIRDMIKLGKIPDKNVMREDVFQTIAGNHQETV